METEYMNYGVDFISEKLEKPYIVSGKSIKTRMRVVLEQLLTDMVTDQDMSQIKKMYAIKRIDMMKLKLTKLAHDEGLDEEIIFDFRAKLGELKLRVLFKKVKEDWELRYKDLMMYR